MKHALYQGQRIVLSHLLEGALRLQHQILKRMEARAPAAGTPAPPPENPQTPEDFRPLENACFQDPYDFYAMLRNDYPVYRLPNGIFCISRFADIVAVSRDHENFSSTHQGIIASLRPGEDIARAGARMEQIGRLGIFPSDVLALSDPPKHTSERKTGHKGFNARFVKSLDPMVEELCREMMDQFIDKGRVEFMQEFGWRLPMQLIIRLLGFPREDYEQIKVWCMHGIRSQSGIASPAEMAESRAAAIAFMRYCWKQFLITQKHPRDDLSRIFVDAVADPDNPMTARIAVSAIFQVLIAGSDSSATSMGNALKMLIDHPALADEIRADIDNKLPAFIEEVFRLEAAFQGHFRWVKNEVTLHDVTLPRGSRVFLMWASGNRDERVFDNPNAIDLNRRNGKKHLTFGHGIHACLGRELARAEIRIVLREFLRRTRNLRLDGEAPFLASMFAHTLVQLPIAFDRADEETARAEAA